jgi:hypothetical protein
MKSSMKRVPTTSRSETRRTVRSGADTLEVRVITYPAPAPRKRAKPGG